LEDPHLDNLNRKGGLSLRKSLRPLPGKTFVYVGSRKRGCFSHFSTEESLDNGYLFSLSISHLLGKIIM
jgi:hypothetical protein